MFMRLYVSLFFVVFIFTPLFVQAQIIPPCGSIIFPADLSDQESVEYSELIQDCSNPLGSTGDLVDFTLNSNQVTNNAVYIVDAEGVVNYGFVGETYGKPSQAIYYLHSDLDLIRVDTSFSLPEKEDLINEIKNYLNGDPIRIALYTNAYLADNKDIYFYVDGNSNQYRLDPITGEPVLGVYYDMEQYMMTNAKSQRKPLLPGTYTVSLTDNSGLNVSLENNLLQKFFAYIFSTAYANFNVNTVTFTLSEPVLKPAGASSVLFLPGIMGSRLYENSSVCDPEGVQKEQKRWVSLEDCDHLRLTTNFIGQSDNNIYTKSGEAGLIDELYSFNIYKTFLAELKIWKNGDIINDFAVVPYDWRSELDNILKSSHDEETRKVKSGDVGSVEEGYLYKTITNLAADSKTGKVTIVAHSNGGLVIKQLLVYLKNKNDPLLNKIDNLILVAVPQLGTPNSLIGILHGEALGPAGLVMKQSISRQLTNTMPFAHHLLPSQTYFNAVQTPVIKFEAGSSTDALRNAFGPEISSTQSLYSFLSVDSGREKPEVDDLSSPEVVSAFLLNNYAKIIDLIQSNWQPPASMKVYQVAGTSLETPAGIAYFTDKECTKRSIINAFLCSEYGNKLGYRVNIVADGDGVVVTPSALAIDNNSNQVERWWLNLLKHNEDGFISLNTNREHKNILEVQDVINFIGNTIQSTSTRPYLYLSTSTPELSNQNRLVFQLHSPLDMSLVTADGRIISSSTNTIKGATYRRYGELQYVSISKTETNSILHLNGLATGSFTLEAEEKNGNNIISHQTYSAIPSSTSTKVVMDLNTNVSTGNILQIDYEGDGKIDVKYDTQGAIAEEVTYVTLVKTITNLNLKPFQKQPLLIISKLAEGFYKKSLTLNKFKYLENLNLNLLLKQIYVYEKYKLISVSERQELERTINSLLNK